MLSQDISRLRERVERWRSELSSPTVRGTLAVGIITKGLLAFEKVLTKAITILVGILDGAGKAQYKLLLGGKTISGCSLGDKVDLLCGLKVDFERALKAKGIQVSDAFLGKDDMYILHSLVQSRNKAHHGKMGTRSLTT